MAEQEIKKGLAGVVVDYTAVSKVNPDTNSLLYRGYPVQELAAKCSFEEVAYLLWNGELPDAGAAGGVHRPGTRRPRPGSGGQAGDRRAAHHLAPDGRLPHCHLGHGRTAPARRRTPRARPTWPRPWTCSPRCRPWWPTTSGRRHGQDVVEPRDDLGYAANFLWMTFGEEAVPEVVDAFNVSMILYAEHSFNASTFTARVITSTLSDLHSAVTGAIGALKGPLHGGANEAVMHTFDEIGIRPEESLEDAHARAKAWMEDALAHKKKVMGFGHRVYKHGDSRVPTMKAALDKMIAHYGRPELLGLYNGLETAMDEAKGIKPNLDYPTGPTYHLMGFDTATFTPLFVASRITGWTAHIMEQLDSNSLIRPLSEYNGVEERHLA